MARRSNREAATYRSAEPPGTPSQHGEALFNKHARYQWLLLAKGHLTRRLFAGHAAEDRSAAVAGGIKRAQSGANFDDDASFTGTVAELHTT